MKQTKTAPPRGRSRRSSGYVLVDVQNMMARLHSEGGEVSREGPLLCWLLPGDFAEVCAMRPDGSEAERFWVRLVRVRKVNGARVMSGVVSNRLIGARFFGIDHGDRVAFEERHVCAVKWSGEGDVYDVDFSAEGERTAPPTRNRPWLSPPSRPAPGHSAPEAPPVRKPHEGEHDPDWLYRAAGVVGMQPSGEIFSHWRFALQRMENEGGETAFYVRSEETASFLLLCMAMQNDGLCGVEMTGIRVRCFLSEAGRKALLAAQGIDEILKAEKKRP